MHHRDISKEARIKVKMVVLKKKIRFLHQFRIYTLKITNVSTFNNSVQVEKKRKKHNEGLTFRRSKSSSPGSLLSIKRLRLLKTCRNKNGFNRPGCSNRSKLYQSTLWDLVLVFF